MPTGPFSLSVNLHTVAVTPHLDRLTRSSDPYLRKRLEDELRPIIRGAGQEFHFNLAHEDLKRYTRTYGEQFVSDPGAELNQYFDVINGRFFQRSIPTQLAVLYLFGGSRSYRPNIAALSAAGEAVAGYCVEQFGYQPLVRPLGVMPDAVLRTRRNGLTRLALAEAKASTRQEAHKLLEQKVSEFFIDIKTRATGFRFRYEGYLVCSLFKDAQEIECAVLHVDLSHYCQATDASRDHDISTTVYPYDQPTERLRSLIRLQAETWRVRDEYLTSIISEEATRSGTLALLEQNNPPRNPEDVDQYVKATAAELGLGQQWESGQELVKDTKAKEEQIVGMAIERYRKRDLDFEE